MKFWNNASENGISHSVDYSNNQSTKTILPTRKPKIGKEFVVAADDVGSRYSISIGALMCNGDVIALEGTDLVAS